MKKYFSRFLRAAASLLCIVSLCGCWNNRELETLGIVMGLGLDTPEGDGGVQLTAQLIRPGELRSGQNAGGDSGGGTGGGTENFWNVQSTGDTVFSAVRDVTDQSSRRLFFPHNQVLIFGKAIAQEGVRQYIDFFVRDPETRDNVCVLVAEGSAKEILSVKPMLEKYPATKITKMVEIQEKSASQVVAVRLGDFVKRLLSTTAAPVAPMIRASGEGEEPSLTITGTAVFKDDRLVGTLDKTEGRGLLWVLSEVKSGIINVEEPDGGGLVALEIIRASGKMTPELRDGKIVMKINVKVEGNVGETTGKGSLASNEALTKLEVSMAQAVHGEVFAAFQKAKALTADIFGFGEAVRGKYLTEFKTMEGNWDEVFRTIELEVNVHAELRLTGRINNPAVPQGE